jgi:hypothetical protein
MTLIKTADGRSPRGNMQFAKDSFYVALRDRLAALDPARTVVVAGRMRPAVLVDENEPANSAPPLPNAFHLAWGAPEIVKGVEAARRPLMKIACTIAYRIVGAQSGSVDRGRALAALDAELLRLTAPPRTPKCDQTYIPPAELGSTVFWGLPEFGAVESAHDELSRQARLAVFFFPEVDQA